MCLEIIARISPESRGRVSARRLSEVSRLRVSKTKHGGEPALHFSVGGGCSCGFLSESAEFDSPVWSLDPAHLPALAEAVALLGSEARPFTFLAHWLDGELPAGTLEVRLPALIKEIRLNQVRNNVVYLVR
jgi:hypothetical protein